MGIEGGFERTIEFRRKGPEIIIEGAEISPIMEIAPDDAVDIPLPATISWKGSRLEFTKVDQSYLFKRRGSLTPLTLYQGSLVFPDAQGVKKKIDLSKTTGNKPSYFTGCRNGFYAHDPLMNGDGSNFFVIGIQPFELEDDQRKIVSLDHELGHALLMKDNDDIKLFRTGVALNKRFLPKFAGIIRYARVLAEAIPERWHDTIKPEMVTRELLFEAARQNQNVDMGVRLFHERFAWAAGINLLRQRQSPTGFERPLSVIKYAKFCLQSYDSYYMDTRFVKGPKDK